MISAAFPTSNAATDFECLRFQHISPQVNLDNFGSFIKNFRKRPLEEVVAKEAKDRLGKCGVGSENSVEEVVAKEPVGGLVLVLLCSHADIDGIVLLDL
jgi:hypothetical protein